MNVWIGYIILFIATASTWYKVGYDDGYEVFHSGCEVCKYWKGGE